METEYEIHTVDRLEDLPDPVPDADFVVIDVLISSTSIVRLLEADAAYVKPFADPDDALAFAESVDDPVLVGEQGGQAVEGFDCGPLPSVLDGYEIEERPVGILTSNGTRAMDRIGHDQDIFVASTVNAEAVAAVIAERDRDTWLVAAGQRGDPVPEDVAGAELVARCHEGDLPEAATESLADDVRTCRTAEWLRGLGFEHEVDALLEFNSSETVPRLRDGVFVAG